MPRNSIPKSKWYDQYYKEYKRVKQAVRRQQKLGYTVLEEVVPVHPKNLQKIRKSDVKRLSKLTPEKIRKSSYYTDPTGWGEAVYGFDVVKANRKSAKSKPKISKTKATKEEQPREQLDTFWYNDDYENVPENYRRYWPGFEHVAIQGFYTQLKQFPNAEGANILSEWFTRIINQFGRHAAAVMLDEGSRDGLIVTWETVYKGGYQVYMTNMVKYLPELTDEDERSLGDIMEAIESWEPPA